MERLHPKARSLCNVILYWISKWRISNVRPGFVAYGHMTKAPATITYANVVSRRTVKMALMMAALNNLEVKLGDILNA